jgi:hypothetical protein
MTTLTPTEKETLRHAILEYLVERARFYFEPAAIARALPRRSYVDFPIDADNVREALSFLEEMKHVQSTVDALGSTKTFKASAQGILAEERRQAEA